MATKRAYASPLRREAAARTREQILGCAADLFAGRGYGRVTVADIAAAAGVSPKTVFASVGSKSDILDRIVDQGVTASGHEEAVTRLLAMSDPRDLLRELAAATRLGNEGQFVVHEAIRKALPAHEQAEELWERATGEYRRALGDVARHLDTLTPRPSTPVEETADLLWFWFGPSGWRTLVVENGWSWERAERFLCRTATATLC
ncbi:TetR/AcrR family transcriptional regulator [Streptomyces sp. Vc74B-19]|uniref:TetR/AcrR family transcriptional regulator n=1 Tax=unclassified Streptomyces TaxID=2593676 RepID=UPI001BFC4671|nr:MULTISPECIES: TetR/AcrR family transcriptional regulator [unclassified Streptomyces]MBT3165808.1 TetR/AcrR family transcriptional regulator [Streptomyces sp. Vc74B-19]MCO4696416.1 TetR/AcrR family transcriptional regulator [Streptomyces sp. RO-S4]MDU0303031.1 TetR/AcrR family transcriptional regulator [Streptomyces sp. PAL114]